MDLNALIVLDKVASLSSFTAAAAELNMPNSNVSLKIKQLEDDLGQAVFTRSTRKVVITEFGQKIRELSQPVLEAHKEIRSLAEGASRLPAGRIRVTSALDVGLFLLRDVIPEFTKTHEKISVELNMSNSFVDIVGGGYDFAIRATTKQLSDSSLISIKLGETTNYLFTRSGGEYSGLKSIKDLKGVPILNFTGNQARISKGQKTEFITTKSQIIVKDMVGIKQAVIGGAGVGLLPEFVVKDLLARGVVEKVLPDWSGATGSFYAVMAKKLGLAAKNRLFLEFLKEKFKN